MNCSDAHSELGCDEEGRRQMTTAQRPEEAWTWAWDDSYLVPIPIPAAEEGDANRQWDLKPVLVESEVLEDLSCQ